MENGQNNAAIAETATNATVAQPQDAAPKAPATGRILNPTVAKTSQSKKEAKVAARKVLTDEDTASRSFVMEGENKMRATFTCRLNEKSKERVLVESVFDYTNCTRAELLELASSSVRIAVQGKMRAMGEDALKGHAFDVVDVKRDIIEAARQARTSLDPMTAAIRALTRASGITEDAARKIVEQTMAKQK